jgi:hypothetical protein
MNNMQFFSQSNLIEKNINLVLSIFANPKWRCGYSNAKVAYENIPIRCLYIFETIYQKPQV